MYRKLYSVKNMDILEASQDISDAEGWGSIRGLKRTEEPLFCQNLTFSAVTEEPLFRSMEPEIKGKETNKGISVRITY
ncbi:hypothetical protein AMQ83_07505 [Paenibacillus riograndensis]|nr:hypothetical protein AMQ83_07505 [Paenibacillus riograndensis]